MNLNRPMTRQEILARWPHASPAVLAANAAPAPPAAGPAASDALAAPQRPGAGQMRKAARRREPNKTEQSFLDILEARRRAGELLTVEYEGLTLRWGDGMVYTPDVFVTRPLVRMPAGELVVVQNSPAIITLYELKGAHCWAKDLVKFRAAKQHAPWRCFEFEFWEKKDGAWSRTI